MLKPLTLSLSLAVALGVCGVSKAGHWNKGCSTCGLASPQGAVASAQCAAPSAQCNVCPKKSCLSCLKGLFHHEPKPVCYEWVLRKRRCGGLFGHGGGCDICGGLVRPSGQVPSAQAAPTGQVYGGGQTPPATAAIPVGDEPPPPPPAEVGVVPPPPTSLPPAANAPQSSLLFLAPAGN